MQQSLAVRGMSIFQIIEMHLQHILVCTQHGREEKQIQKKNVLLSIDIECPIITGVQESITGVFILLHHTNDKI